MPTSGIVTWTLSVFFVLIILGAAAFARYHIRTPTVVINA
jgi:hypothetical protein